MQPYLFPYIGYFQLIEKSDHFVFLDDVNHIKKGWVHRNRILLNRAPHTFSTQLSNSSQNVLIKDLELFEPEKWKTKFLASLKHAYGKQPLFKEVYQLVDEALDAHATALTTWQVAGLKAVAKYCGLERGVLIFIRFGPGSQSSGRR